jgi:cytochrome c-type biogenesis protein CcmH/NrfF
MARNLALIFLTALLSISALAAAAETELTPAQEETAQEIFGSVMSPFCVARSLRDCPSSQAQELKDQIKAQLAQGITRAEIEAALLTKFGDRIRSMPDASSFGLIGWLAPAAFAIIGFCLVIFFGSKRREPSATTAPGKPVDSEMEARIKAELSKFE